MSKGLFHSIPLVIFFLIEQNNSFITGIDVTCITLKQGGCVGNKGLFGYWVIKLETLGNDTEGR